MVLRGLKPASLTPAVVTRQDSGHFSSHAPFIFSCDFIDTAQYRVSALNIKGEASSVATVVVKSRLRNTRLQVQVTQFSVARFLLLM